LARLSRSHDRACIGAGRLVLAGGWLATTMSLCLAALVSACASRSRPPVGPGAVAVARQAVERGCYVGLRDALAGARSALGRSGSTPLRREAFTMAILLAVRQRQLRIAGDDYLAVATELAAGLGSWTRTWLEVASALGSLLRPRSPEEGIAARALLSSRFAVWRAALEADPSAATVFLLRTLECHEDRGAAGRLRPLPADDGEPPILAWQRATCGPPDLPALAALLEREPCFAEAAYQLAIGSIRLGRLAEAEPRLEAAVAALPEWLAAWISLGNVRLGREDFDGARRAYDAALQVSPDGPEARLGRLKSLSYLGDHAAALEEADRLLALEEWFIGEAHFWRAWNLARLDRYEEARRDVAAAKPRLHNAELYKLSGTIERSLGQSEAARAELARARELAPEDCEVPYLEGDLEASVGQWTRAAGAFAAAGTCYVQEEVRLRAALEQDARAEATEPRVVARRRREIEEAHDRQGASFLGAGLACARAGRHAEARDWATRALDYPRWAGQARALLQQLPPPQDLRDVEPRPDGLDERDQIAEVPLQDGADVNLRREWLAHPV
jgi:tetratricopeptide (TPR) repeat protein